MRTYYLLLLIIFSYSSPKSQSTDERLKGLDAELTTVLETWNAAGFAVAVVEKDKVIYEKGFGYKDYENKIPVDENTLFAIGSCTKSFTASVLGILGDEGKLSLQDSPIKHIPELRFFNDELNTSINIEDLMSHRTGIPRHDFSWYFFPIANKDSLIQRIEFHEPFTGFREQWYYNNFMFLLQGVVGERITGKSWEDNVREMIFKPLGMEDSNITIQEMKDAKNASYGYNLEEDSIINKMDYYDISGMGAAGSINSSVHEMSNWLITWINGGKFKGEKIIPESYANQAMTSKMIVNSGFPGEENPDLHFANYGYGWFMSSYKGHYRVEHGGNIDGFSANTCFFPSDSIGVVVLANQNGSTIPSVVRNIVADRLLNLERTDWNKDLKERRDKAIQQAEEAESSGGKNMVEGTTMSRELEGFGGKYAHPGYGTMIITTRNDSLFAKMKIHEFYLKHFHYDVFDSYMVQEGKVDSSDNIGILFNFRTGNDGEISGVEAQFEPTIDALFFEKELIEVEVAESLLEQYSGEYELAGMTVKIYIKGENTLYAFVPGQPEYELMSLGDNEFALKALDGFKIKFIPNEDGEFMEVDFTQPNGTFRAKRKTE